MTPDGAFLLAWFGGVVVATVVLGCVTAVSKSAKIKFASIVLTGVVWSSPMFVLFLGIVFEGTVLAIGPPATRRRGNETTYAVIALLCGSAILWAFIRDARSGAVAPAVEEKTPNK